MATPTLPTSLPRAEDAVYFYGGLLSQWAATPFVLGDTFYPTAEHYMMATKAHLFRDVSSYNQILRAQTPSEAKALGRKVVGFNPGVWDAVKIQVVLDGNLAKFKQNPPSRRYLCLTGNRLLVEASPTDRIWGIGFSPADALANIERWGQNLLGLCLMVVRGQVRGLHSW